MFCNYDALLGHGVARDFEHHWLVAHAFQVLNDMYDHNEFGAQALQTHIEKGIACPLAITPLANLSCLNSSKLFPLFAITKNVKDMTRELGLKYCESITNLMYAKNQKWDAKTYTGPVQPDFLDVMTKSKMLCLDGDLEDVLFITGEIQVTRHHLL